jgi:membrane dipeptidase
LAPVQAVKLIVDTHLDLAWNALAWKRDITLPLEEINRREEGLTDHLARGNATTSLPEMRRGGVALAAGTLLARVPSGPGGPAVRANLLDYPSQEIAYGAAQGQLAYYRILQNRGELSLIRTATELAEHWRRWQAAGDAGATTLPVGIVLAMEGCDSIADPDQAAEWFGDGLRVASLVHYGRSPYAAGTGDDGPLTRRGRDMLRAFEELGIILDVTHLSATSFREVMNEYRGPLLASHQNCRALVPGDRQFSDEQIQAVIERGGILGAACDCWMLHPGWVRGATLEETTPRDVVRLEAVADHIDRVCQLAGSSGHAALGSDLDGCFGREQTPAGLDSIADLQKLAGILSSRGYADSDIDAIFHGNALRFFQEHLPRGAAS